MTDRPAGEQPVLLRTDGAVDPLGVDEPHPRFRWRPRTDHTSAFQVLVASDRSTLEENVGDVWDTGKVDRADSVDVTYDGPPLESGTRHHWKVRTWDRAGTPSAWSDPATWETGLDPEDWEAEWIAAAFDGYDGPAPNPYARRSFSVGGDVEHARLYVAGAGLYEAYLNGDRVGDAELDTAITDYEERVLYATHDVTSLVRRGENTLGLVGGRGRYAMTTENVWAWHETPWQSEEPHLRAQLEVTRTDGSTTVVSTGADWEVTEGGTRFDSLYGGERYNAQREPVDWTVPEADDDDEKRTGDETGGWRRATVVDGPAGEMAAQELPPMNEVRSVDPIERTEPDDGVSVVRFDEMLVGWASVTVDAPAGAAVTIRYGERLREDGRVSVDQGHDPPLINAEIQTDQYIAAGGGPESWEPRFSYKGFRYLEVECPEGTNVVDVTGKAVYTPVDADCESDFAASDSLLTDIHGNVRRALLDNHHGIPTDTPVYEKNGWTGDAQLAAETMFYNFEMGRFYRKWLADFADAQRESGEIPPIVPTSDWGYSEAPKDGAITGPLPGFDAAVVFLPWWVYRYEGDQRTLARYYDAAAGYVDYLSTHAEDGIVTEGLGDWYSPLHGDRDDPRGPEGPALVGTAYYYRMADVLARAGRALGRDDDARRFAARRDEVEAAFDSAFFDADAGIYRTGEADEYRQTSNVLPLAFGLVPDERVDSVVSALVNDVVETQDTHLNTGIHGTKHLLPVLTDHGYVNLAYDLATRTTYPSWGAWLADGATSLYEAWELDSRSLNHFFKGTVDDWFYRYLGGLAPAEPGWKSVTVRPYCPANLDAIEATVDTVRGPVTSAWKQDDGRVTHEITVPPATTATVELPQDTRPVDSDPRDHGVDSDRRVYEVGPGSWAFATTDKADR